MRRTLITTSVVAMLALAACSSGDTGGSASAPPLESAPASEGASAGASESAAASGGTGMVDPASVSGDLTLQGWSAGAVEAPILRAGPRRLPDGLPERQGHVRADRRRLRGLHGRQVQLRRRARTRSTSTAGPPRRGSTTAVIEPLDDYIAKTGFDTSVFYPAYLDAFKGADGKTTACPRTATRSRWPTTPTCSRPPA